MHTLKRLRAYGKFVPVAQTTVDIILSNIILILLLYCFDLKDASVFNRHLIWPFELTLLLTLPGFYASHARRMLRSEKLVRRGLIDAFMQTVFFAAILTFFGVAGVKPMFFLLMFIGLWFVYSIAWLIELLMIKHLRRLGYNTHRVLIIGTGPSAQELTRRLVNDKGYGNRIVGYIGEERDNPEIMAKRLCDEDKMLEVIERLCKQKKVDEIFYARTSVDATQLNQIISMCDRYFRKFYLVPVIDPQLQCRFYMISLNASIPAVAIHPTPLKKSFNKGLKRAFDIIFSGTFLLFSPLIFIPVAIAIKMSSPGPVFFKQKRTGYRGHDFWCYKFRTMRVNSDADSVQATKDDDRKTKVGNFLRHTSIDELPQFINVLLGDMSIVGPRPHMLAHTKTYSKIINKYMVRHLVKPGITGWAQVQGFRGATDELWQMEGRVNADVWYIEHWSFFLDLKIIVKTITNAIHGEENAY